MASRPTGTVTFLFTDIEGSTRLALQGSAFWVVAKERHHAILQSAIETRSGYIFQTIGDAFCAAFHTALDAVSAALDAQRALAAEPWGTAIVRVRMGLHTGVATLREDGDYDGYLTLVRVQRIMAAAHGGQVLISQASADLVGESPPEGVTLLDLGSHRLKDLNAPEHLYQLSAPGLVSGFPPLKTASIPNNLPAQLTSFVGREGDLAEVQRLLEGTRLLTLTGAGGVGKTRLALRLGSAVLSAFADGVWFVELAPLADPTLIPNAIASAAGVRESPDRPLLTLLCENFRAKSALLLFDNCEHVLAQCADIANLLLHAAPRLKIVATSREALGTSGEQAYRVPSLRLPEKTAAPNELATVDSVRLFIERARAAKPDFAVHADNSLAVAQICRRLDGVPLAIELAAARVKVLSAEQIAARLDDRFRLLTGGSRTALPRQQTLRAAIDWSHNLLSDPERMLLRRLSVFAGGWTLEACESVCAEGGLESADVFDLLSHLVDKSLVVPDEKDGQARYRLLETVRQYAREKLLNAGEVEAVRDHHLEYCVGLAAQGGKGMEGREQLLCESRLEAEWDNIRVALDWALEAPRIVSGLRILGSLWFFMFLGHVGEALSRSRALLDSTEGREHTSLRARTLAMAVLPAAWVVSQNLAIEFARESVEIAREVKDSWAEAYALQCLSMVGESNDLDLMTRSLQITREVGDTFLEGWVLWEFAELHLRRGEVNEAISMATVGVRILQRIGDRHLQAGVRRALARALLRSGDQKAAAEQIHESLRLNRLLNEEIGMARTLCVSAEMSAACLDFANAARYCGAALAWFEAGGLQLFALHADEDTYLRAIAVAQASLDPTLYAAAFEEGRSLSLFEAVDLAMGGIRRLAASPAP